MAGIGVMRQRLRGISGSAAHGGETSAAAVAQLMESARWHGSS